MENSSIGISGQWTRLNSLMIINTTMTHIRIKRYAMQRNLIRLITRIIFIRFLTEKGLIPPELFSSEKLGRIVKDFMKGKKASNFYNAILQNLFFGTLNQKMDERKFAQESGFQSNKKNTALKIFIVMEINS